MLKKVIYLQGLLWDLKSIAESLFHSKYVWIAIYFLKDVFLFHSDKLKYTIDYRFCLQPPTFFPKSPEGEKHEAETRTDELHDEDEDDGEAIMDEGPDMSRLVDYMATLTAGQKPPAAVDVPPKIPPKQKEVNGEVKTDILPPDLPPRKREKRDVRGL